MIVTTTCRITTDETVRGPNVVVPPDPGIIGIINVTDTIFKSYIVSNMGDESLFVVDIITVGDETQITFIWDEVEEHYRTELGELVADDLLDISEFLQAQTSDIIRVEFYLTNFSDFRYFYLAQPGAPKMEVDIDPDPAMVDTTLEESFIDGPQEVLISDPTAFEFHLLARFVPPLGD